jgi:hypothetical protein
VRVFAEQEHLIGPAILDQLFGQLLLDELNEGRSFGSVGLLIKDDFRPFHFTVLAEECLQGFLVNVCRQVANKHCPR